MIKEEIEREKYEETEDNIRKEYNHPGYFFIVMTLP